MILRGDIKFPDMEKYLNRFESEFFGLGLVIWDFGMQVILALRRK